MYLKFELDLTGFFPVVGYLRMKKDMFMKQVTRLLSSAILFSLIYINSIVFAASANQQTFYQAALNSYLYAYPLVIMNVTKQVMTNVPNATTSGRSPINQFSHAETLVVPSVRDVVRPSCDTLYSTAWLDLSQEPLILSIPDTDGRYYLLPLLDAWTEVVASPGKRTLGTTAKNYILLGPDHWNHEIPGGLEVIRIPTNLVWINGRTLVNDIDDLDNARRIQRKYKITPFSSWGKEYTPPVDLPVDPNIDMKTVPYEQLDKMTVEEFFTMFTTILKKNPPHFVDTTILDDLKVIGIIPGQNFDISHYTKAELRELSKAVSTGLRKIKTYPFKETDVDNGWLITSDAGKYSTDYLARAAMSYYGIGANIPEDSLYPAAFTDEQRVILNGTNRYILHFRKFQIPPVKGFWSVTLYGQDGYLVANKLNRYRLGDRDQLQFNYDGSLDIYVQHESPGIDKESNWLPAPLDEFNLLMRLYWPEQKILKGFWHPPEIKKQTQSGVI